MGGQEGHVSPERTTTRMAEAVVVGVESYIREFAVATRRVVSVLISHLGSIMIAPVIAFYLTRDVDDIKERFASWLPADFRDRIMGAISGIDEALAGWVRGPGHHLHLCRRGYRYIAGPFRRRIRTSHRYTSWNP